jgi:thioesterase domain-containing protein
LDLDRALHHLDAHYQAMPPVAALQLRIAGFDGTRLRLRAPLAAHVNDKGCAFGGSLGSLMTLAGWGLVTLRLQEAGLVAEVFVAESQVRYRAPLFADLEAEAELDAGVDWAALVARLHERGRFSVQVEARVRLPGGDVAAESTARFVAIAKGYDAR